VYEISIAVTSNPDAFHYRRVSNQIKSKKKNLYSARYSTDSEALGRRIKWGRRNDTDKFLSVFWKQTSTGRLFHRGAATENARLASSVRVLGTIRRGVLEGRSEYRQALIVLSLIYLYMLCGVWLSTGVARRRTSLITASKYRVTRLLDYLWRCIYKKLQRRQPTTPASSKFHFGFGLISDWPWSGVGATAPNSPSRHGNANGGRGLVQRYVAILLPANLHMSRLPTIWDRTTTLMHECGIGTSEVSKFSKNKSRPYRTP